MDTRRATLPPHLLHPLFIPLVCLLIIKLCCLRLYSQRCCLGCADFAACKQGRWRERRRWRALQKFILAHTSHMHSAVDLFCCHTAEPEAVRLLTIAQRAFPAVIAL